jgi:peptidoglycan/xylan/chitin deacetylase (PgdA/CDA1 family)
LREALADGFRGHGFPFFLAVVVCLLAILASCSHVQTFVWPDGRQAAIALTYDDGLRSQLDVAIPQLDRAGLKGTFFLNGTFAQEDLLGWRAAAAEGHELGNHTVFHPAAAARLRGRDNTTARFTPLRPC